VSARARAARIAIPFDAEYGRAHTKGMSKKSAPDTRILFEVESSTPNGVRVYGHAWTMVRRGVTGAEVAKVRAEHKRAGCTKHDVRPYKVAKG